MNDDSISRQTAIDGFYEMASDTDHLCTVSDYVSFLESLPSAQPDWIPCNERLPKFGKTVLITNDKGNVSYGRFRGVEFWKEDGDYYWTWKKNTIEHVLAWMPLPEPWRGEQDE